MIGHITCEKCAARLKYDDQRMGNIQTCPCPKCGATIRLPAQVAAAVAPSAASPPATPPVYAPAKTIATQTQPVSPATAVATSPAPESQRKGSSAAVWIVASVLGVVGAGTLFSVVVCAGVAVFMGSSRSTQQSEGEAFGSISRSPDYSSPYGSSTAPSLTPPPPYIPPVTYDPSPATLPSEGSAMPAAAPLPLPWRTGNTPATAPVAPVASAPTNVAPAPWYFDDSNQGRYEDDWDEQVRRLDALRETMRDMREAP